MFYDERTQRFLHKRLWVWRFLAALTLLFGCSAAIRACETEGNWQEALAILGEMPRLRSEPIVVSYSAPISACEKGERWQEASSIVSDMQRLSVEANVICAKIIPSQT